MTPTSPGTRDEASPASLCVLVVDDDDRNRKLALDVLRAAGLRTLEAESGRAALSRATEHRPDVILLDLELPDVHGMEVARALKRDPRTARIPVVALSALRLADAADGLEAAGFAGYLEKPIDVRAFPEQVRRLSERGGA